MKRKVAVLVLVAGMSLLVGYSTGCTSNPNLPVYPAYAPASWPDYAADWASEHDLAGDKFVNWAALDVTINDDGTFSGTYQHYVYDYTWMMPTYMGDIPVNVYNPAGTPKGVTGAIDFDNLKGIIYFEDIGETTFDLTIHSSNELAFVYPDSFTAFTVTNIKRP